jgi:hypothetical protein
MPSTRNIACWCEISSDVGTAWTLDDILEIHRNGIPLDIDKKYVVPLFSQLQTAWTASMTDGSVTEAIVPTISNSLQIV